MELIGKGHHAKGSVWVARRVPDGFVCAHANQEIPLSAPEPYPNLHLTPTMRAYTFPASTCCCRVMLLGSRLLRWSVAGPSCMEILQARITTWPRDNTVAMWAADVVSFAKQAHPPSPPLASPRGTVIRPCANPRLGRYPTLLPGGAVPC